MKLSSLALGLIVIALAGLTTNPVGAQTTSANAAQGIEIRPALVELNAAQGKIYTITLKVRNVTASDLVYDSAVNDFDAAGESGSPHIVTTELPSTSSMKAWVSTIPQFTLRAHQVRTITAQVFIPANAELGGHYGVIRFSGRAPAQKDTGLGLSASAGVLLLVRVEGAITEKASLASFYTAQNGKQSSFFEMSPIAFVTRIRNEGNIHIKPAGSIELHDMFGRLVSTMPVNEGRSNVLPASIRRFETIDVSAWMIGRYTANLTLGYGTTGQAITNTISFWVVPYKLILVSLAALITVIFIFSRMIRVYNRRIIAKSKNENTTKNKKHTNKKG